MICCRLSNFAIGNCPPAQSVSHSEFAKVGSHGRSKILKVFLDSAAHKQPLSNEESLVWMPEFSCRMPQRNLTASIVQMEGKTKDHWAFLGSCSYLMRFNPARHAVGVTTILAVPWQCEVPHPFFGDGMCNNFL